jgi:hypothetical protein
MGGDLPVYVLMGATILLRVSTIVESLFGRVATR